MPASKGAVDSDYRPRAGGGGTGHSVLGACGGLIYTIFTPPAASRGVDRISGRCYRCSVAVSRREVARAIALLLSDKASGVTGSFPELAGGK